MENPPTKFSLTIGQGTQRLLPAVCFCPLCAPSELTLFIHGFLLAAAPSVVLYLQWRRQLVQILAIDSIAPHVAGSGSGYGIPPVHLLVLDVRDLATTVVTLDASKAFITISFSTDNTRWTSLAFASGNYCSPLQTRFSTTVGRFYKSAFSRGCRSLFTSTSIGV